MRNGLGNIWYALDIIGTPAVSARRICQSVPQKADGTEVLVCAQCSALIFCKCNKTNGL